VVIGVIGAGDVGDSDSGGNSAWIAGGCVLAGLVWRFVLFCVLFVCFA